VRRIAANLRPSLLDDLGLSAAVEWLLEDFQKRTGVNCELEINFEELDFDSGICTALFRILQEAVTNVARYAQASELKVTLKDEDGVVFLSVTDDGIGFDIQEKQHNCKSFGLLGMRERVNALGGRFEMDSQVGMGTQLRAYIPKPIKL
jgi:signal transduction histidine kinase